MKHYFCFVAMLILCQACAMSDSQKAGNDFSEISISTMPNWQNADFKNSAEALRNSCRSLSRHDDRITGGSLFHIRYSDWQELCDLADRLKDSEMRWFLKTYFVAYAYSEGGFYTGYFEAHINGSNTRSKKFHHPVLTKPQKNQPKRTRREIEKNYKDYEVLFWTDDPIDLFLAQIQGSARVTFTDGSQRRIGYGGNNGYGYTSIGRYLLQSGKAKSLEDGWLSVREYLETHPDAAQDIMWQNDRYIFFKLRAASDDEIYGRLDTPLIGGRSMAADSKLMPFGVPVWVTTPPHSAAPIDGQLMFIQDTGSAIKGIARGDIFFGFGEQALNFASRLQDKGKFYILLPKNYIRRIK